MVWYFVIDSSYRLWVLKVVVRCRLALFYFGSSKKSSSILVSLSSSKVFYKVNWWTGGDADIFVSVMKSCLQMANHVRWIFTEESPLFQSFCMVWVYSVNQFFIKIYTTEVRVRSESSKKNRDTIMKVCSKSSILFNESVMNAR